MIVRAEEDIKRVRANLLRFSMITEILKRKAIRG
jgi:hypothetical protein